MNTNNIDKKTEPTNLDEKTLKEKILKDYMVTMVSETFRLNELGSKNIKLKKVVQIPINDLLSLIKSTCLSIKTSKVDRFEVVDNTGRAYVKGSIYGTPVKVELSFQDDGKTLKVFISEVTNE